MNMNYCIFENTSNDMKQALGKLERVLEGSEGRLCYMRDSETEGLHSLVELAVRITAMVANKSLDHARLTKPLTSHGVQEAAFVKSLAYSLNIELREIFHDTIDRAVEHGQLLDDEYEAELAASEAEGD